MMALSDATDEELRQEVARRASKRLTEIGKDRYHPRRKMFEILEQLERDHVFYKFQAVTISGAKFWLDYHEYCNAFGGVIYALMAEVDGEEHSKNFTETHCLDIEVEAWLNLIRRPT